MEQQSKRQTNIRDSKITELEAKLECAFQVIANLQQQNLALQNQVTEFQKGENQQSAFVVIPASVSPSENSQYQKKQTIAGQQHSQANVLETAFIRKYRLTKLPHLQFYGLIALVIMVIVTLSGLGILVAHRGNNRNSKPINNLSVQPSTILPDVPNSDIAPTNVTVNIPNNSPVMVQPVSPLYPNSEPKQGNLELVYNVTPPNLKHDDKKLNSIISDLIKLAKEKNLPVDPLSITLIDVNQKLISGYKQDTARYPASVFKMFWMAALEAQIKKGLLSLNTVNGDLNKMILKSDNDAASRILDIITDTHSERQLGNEQFNEWKKQRTKLNVFFQGAGYKDINISQKTFPIPYLQIAEPKGTDLQIRGDNPNKPTRNKITTYQAARLMYEIVNHQAVGHEYSEQMVSLLTRDLRPEAWKLQPPNPDEFNPVENFLGESLSSEPVNFASKAGWTSASRQEVAYIQTKDGKNRYILAIFGDDPAYAASKKIFPEMSRFVFDRITNRE